MSSIRFAFILLIFTFFVRCNLIAKTDNRSLQIQYEVAGLTGSGDFAPFWHTSNRQGLPSVECSNGYTHLATVGNMQPNGVFCVDYGIDLGVGAGLENNMFLHQLYVDVDYKWLGISLGMKERWGDKNHYLSSGALTWSGNSKPIPEIRAGIPDYIPISFLNNWISIKGQLGYGRLTDDKWRTKHSSGSYVDGVLFHSKSLFLRFGDEERFPLQASLGLEMNNLFGGTRHIDGKESPMPSDFDAYWIVLFPFHKIEEQGNDGNSVGSWHLNFDYYSDWHISAYYEHYYEDHSSMLGVEYKYNTEGEKNFISFGLRRNWFDGLFGIELNAPNDLLYFRSVVLEFLNTRWQCGPICHSAACNTDGMYVIEEVDGRDGMYNHNIYDSYTHHGYAIGNPVLISPVYNNVGNRFRSNRVRMFHLGVDGSITNQIDYRLLATTTQHWGRYGAPLKEVERISSVMLECSYRMGNSYDWKFSLSGAIDFDSGSGGEYLLGNNLGVMLTVRRTWKVL